LETIAGEKVSNFIIKNEQRIRPADKNTNPEWKREEAIARRNWPKMEKKFKSEEDKKRYLKAIESNPMSHVGGPALYPPLEILEYMSGLKEMTLEELNKQRIEKFQERQIREKMLYCRICDEVTAHSSSITQTFCHTCGSQWKPPKEAM
jgi:hypothetical protein